MGNTYNPKSVNKNLNNLKMNSKFMKLLDKPKNSESIEKLFLAAKKEGFVKKPVIIRPTLATVQNRGTKRSKAISQDACQQASTSSQDWQMPRKTFKLQDNQSLKKSEEILNQNKFEALNANDDMEITDSSGPAAAGSQTTFTNGTSQSEKTDPNAKKEKPPPINILGTAIEEIAKLLIANGISKGEFLLRLNDAGSVTLKCNSLATYNKSKTVLSTNNKPFYTYTPKSNKPKNLIIKGIHGNYTDNEILTEIKSLNIPSVNITKLSKIYFNKRQNPVYYHYLLQITPDSDANALKQINNIAHQKIRWENLKRNKVFQCKNCQRVGHTSACCSLPYRCVKCAKSHDPGNCEIAVNSDKSVLQCANCGESGHPASYMGCPFLKYAQKLNMINSKKTSSDSVCARTFQATY